MKKGTAKLRQNIIHSVKTAGSGADKLKNVEGNELKQSC